MSMRVIAIEPEAPAKPVLGQACNGCGVCCLAEPCPIGILLSRRRYGRCAALVWESSTARYRCGVFSQPRQALAWPRAPVWLLRPFVGLARRWISAGSGCDSSATTAGRTG